MPYMYQVKKTNKMPSKKVPQTYRTYEHRYNSIMPLKKKKYYSVLKYLTSLSLRLYRYHI